MDIDVIKLPLRAFIVQHFAVRLDDTEFTDDVHLFDYGYIDSFGAVELVEFIQEQYGTTVSQADLVAYPLNTIDEIATFVSLRQRGEL